MIDRKIVKGILPGVDNGEWGETIFSKKCTSEHEARSLYQYLKLSLLDVGSWNKKKKGLSLQCYLLDSDGIPVGRIARQGDRIKILLPRWRALFQEVGWFEIQRLEERLNQNLEFFYFTMASMDDPLADTETDFTDRALTITIFIVHGNHKVDLQIHSVDYQTTNQTKPIRNQTRSLFKSFFVSAGFYKRQWSKLVKSLLDEGLAHLTNLN